MITNLAFVGTNASGIPISSAPITPGSTQAISNDTPMNGDLLATNISPPPTPTLGSSRIYVDVATKLLSLLDDSGRITRTILPAVGSPGQFMTGISSSGACQFATPAQLPRNYIDGLVVTNDATSPNNVLDFSAGQAADSTNVVAINNGGTFTKSTAGLWGPGSGGNGMGNGLTVAINTWYFAFAILNAGLFDVYYDTSISAANAPTGTTAFRLIYMFKTDGSAHIIPVNQNPANPEEFLWVTPTKDIGGNPGAAMPTTATNITINVPPMVLNALIQGVAFFSSLYAALSFSSPAVASTALPVLAQAPGGNYNGALVGVSNYAGGDFNVRTNASQQISVMAVTGGAGSTYWVYTKGWIWKRGKL